MASTITLPYPPTETNKLKGVSQVKCSSVVEIIEAAVQKDLKAKRREYLFSPPSWLQRHFLPALQDSRDEPVAMLLMNILLVTLPSAVLLLLGPQKHWLGLIHVAVNYILLFPRFVVALLHVTEHRRLFKSGIVTSIVRAKACTCSSDANSLEWCVTVRMVASVHGLCSRRVPPSERHRQQASYTPFWHPQWRVSTPSPDHAPRGKHRIDSSGTRRPET